MSENHQPQQASDRARALLSDMWTVRRSEVVVDMARLREMLQSLVESPHETVLRTHAQRLAHQMVGVLGVFGLTDIKNLMARVDIELSDADTQMDRLIMLVDDIVARLP